MAKVCPDLVREASYGTLLQEPMYPNVAQTVTINGGTSNRNSTDFTSVIIEVCPTVDCFYALGSSTVQAQSGEDHFLPAYTRKSLNTGSDTRIAVQNCTSGEIGVLYISEMT